MAQYCQDFTISSNTDQKIRFENIINESTGSVIGVGDIIGASWGMTPYEDNVTPLIQKDLTTGGILVPEDGVVVVIINKSDTEGISGEFTHELRLTHLGGTQPAALGKVTIKYQVATNPL